MGDNTDMIEERNDSLDIEPSENPWFTALRVIAARGIIAQERRDSDVEAHDGTLWCSVCGEPRRKYIELENGDHKTPLLVSCKCRCDREKQSAEEEEEKKKELSAEIEDLYADSLMDGCLRNYTFDKFVETENNKKNRKICIRYASAFEEMEARNQGLIMHGRPGTGKTFAAACIANSLINRGISVVMTSFVKILSYIDSEKKSESALLDKLQQARLLIIDDLGAERGTEYALEKVYGIIDARYRSGKPIILTTNLKSVDMFQEDDVRLYRIYDRVWQMCYQMAFNGDSWRAKEGVRKTNEIESFLLGEC